MRLHSSRAPAQNLLALRRLPDDPDNPGRPPEGGPDGGAGGDTRTGPRT